MVSLLDPRHAIFQLSTEPNTVQEATTRVSRILDAKYDKANLVEVLQSNCTHLSVGRQSAILNLLRQYEDLFDGTLRNFYTELVHLNLKKDAVPKYHKPLFQYQKKRNSRSEMI